MTIEKTFNFQALSDSIKLGLINHLQMKIKKALGDKDLGNAAKLLLQMYLYSYLFYRKWNTFSEIRICRWCGVWGSLGIRTGLHYFICFLGKHVADIQCIVSWQRHMGHQRRRLLWGWLGEREAGRIWHPHHEERSTFRRILAQQPSR